MDVGQRRILRLREVRDHVQRENCGMVLKGDPEQKPNLLLDEIDPFFQAALIQIRMTFTRVHGASILF
jgi:hypothetical protein